MTVAIVYAFAAEKGADPIPRAAPLAVLGRQLPRLLVSCLNGDRDRGVRFFPLMGQVDGRRRFFEPHDMLPVDGLLQLHGQDATPQLLIDGRLSATDLTLRIVDGESGRPKFEDRLPFSPDDPWPTVRRVLFEITGELGWQGRPPPVPDHIVGEALGWWLVARDDLLALEAHLLRGDPPQMLRAACEAFARAPDAPEVRDVFLDLARRMVKAQLEPDAVAAAALACADAVDESALDFVEAAARLVEVAADLERATPLWSRVATAAPEREEAARKVAAARFQVGDVVGARDLLRRSFAAGCRQTELLAQLAALEEECGDLTARDDVVQVLLDPPRELGAPVARLLASWLVEHERAQDAVDLLDAPLRAEPDHAGMLFENGRALLALHRHDEARASLQRCLDSRPTDECRRQATRFLRFASDPDLLPLVEALERAHASPEGQRDALARAKLLVRRSPDLAEAWVFLGIARQRLGHDRRAIRAFRRALEVQPELGDAHNRLGILLVSGDDPDEGYRHLRRAVELLRHQASAWLHLAQACCARGRHDEGLEALAEAERVGAHPEQVAAVRRMFDSA